MEPRQFKSKRETERAAMRDSKSVYGRPHPGNKNLLKHHTGETYDPKCKRCVTDAAKGEHPNAPKEGK